MSETLQNAIEAALRDEQIVREYAAPFAADAALDALGLDPLMSVAELQSLLAIGRAAKDAQVCDDGQYGVSVGRIPGYGDETVERVALASAVVLLNYLLAAGVVEQQGDRNGR